VTYRILVDPAARRHVQSWGLSDYLWVEVELRLNERPPQAPTTLLERDPSLFGGEGMAYKFRLIDPDNRMRVHFFVFQVFYHADEATLLVTRGARLISEGL
jgi:hypothetical protein